MFTKFLVSASSNSVSNYRFPNVPHYTYSPQRVNAQVAKGQSFTHNVLSNCKHPYLPDYKHIRRQHKHIGPYNIKSFWRGCKVWSQGQGKMLKFSVEAIPIRKGLR